MTLENVRYDASPPINPTEARPWRTRSRRWAAASTLVAIVAAATGCASSTDPTPAASATSPLASTSPTPTPAESSRPGGTSTAAGSASSGSASPGVGTTAAATQVRVTVGTRTFQAELYDNPTARDLASQLPLTLNMDDLNGLEKTGRLPRALTTEGVPAGSDPAVGSIGYYAPGQDLVLYYGDVGYYNGIITIGRFTTSIDAVADEPDGVSVSVLAK